GKKLGIATRHPRPAAGPDLDLGDAERLQGAQRVARDDAADPEALGDVLFAADEVAGLEALLVKRLAHLGHDLRRERRGATGRCDAPLAVRAKQRMYRHAAQPSRDGIDSKDSIFQFPWP